MQAKTLSCPLEGDLGERVNDLLDVCFPHESKKEKDFEEEIHYITPKACVLALEGDEVVGVVLLFPRNIKYGDKDIFLGGIGGTCVKKEFRGKGIAVDLMKAGLEELKKIGCDIAFLGTDEEVVQFYEKVGFVSLGRKYIATGKSGKKYFREVGMIAPLNSKEKFDLILKEKEPFDLQGGE